MIKWNRSDEGYVSSKNGDWEIFPIYIGRTEPQGYELYRGSEKISGRALYTQLDAKALANRIVEEVA